MKDNITRRINTLNSYRTQRISNGYIDFNDNYRKENIIYEDLNNMKHNNLIRNIFTNKAVKINSLKQNQTNNHLKELCRDLKISLNITDVEIVPKKGI